MPSATNTGVPYPGGRVNSSATEQFSEFSYFDVKSTTNVSHSINVSEVPLLLRAFHMVEADVVEVLLCTKRADNSEITEPMVINNRPVTLSAMNDVLLIDLPGYYRLRLAQTSLGTATVVGQETNMSYNSYGLASYGVSGEGYSFVETATVHPVVTVNSVAENVKLSATPGNLIRINPDGLYYGTAPPDQFANQYVSSSTGNDSNAGTINAPLLTIQKALSNLPDGTTGNIYLLAGDTFHTYPTATTDVINTLTLNQTLQQSLSLDIGNRKVNIYPYNDPAITAINAYNVANTTVYQPVYVNEINFPIIQVTISLPTDFAAYISLPFTIGTNGFLAFRGLRFVVGQTGTLNPSTIGGAIQGLGTAYFQGGHIILGSIPVATANGDVASQNITLDNVQVADHATVSTPPKFCTPNQQYTITTSIDSAGGANYVPTLPYTFIGNNTNAYLAAAALWPGITIYSTAYRSYSNVTTTIPIA